MQPAVYGPYVLLERIGTGGSGDAFLARSIDRSRNIPAPIVLKRLHPPLVESEHFVKRFLHEAEIALNTDSPHVARLYDVGAAEGTFYQAIEYVPGWTLTAMLTELVDTQQLPPIPLVARLMTQALIGLDALHNARGDDGVRLDFVHRDIAPKNIMLGDDGVVRIIDLGLGKSNVQDWRTATGTILGSLGYMSPEQIEGKETDQRTDIYSMGVVFYELLTVKRYIRYGGVIEMVHDALNRGFTPPSAERPEVPRALDEILECALAREPRDRFNTAQQFLEALLRAIPPQTTYEEIRRFLSSLFGSRIAQRRKQIEMLLAQPLPARAIARNDTVILGTRPGVERFSDNEPDTMDTDDLGEAPTFDGDRDTNPGLDAIPPGDTEPAGIIERRDRVHEVIRRAMAVRSRLPTNHPRRREITETLANLAIARSRDESNSKGERIETLRERLEELID